MTKIKKMWQGLVRKFRKGTWVVCSTKHESYFPPTHTRIKRCGTCGEVLRAR